MIFQHSGIAIAIPESENLRRPDGIAIAIPESVGRRRRASVRRICDAPQARLSEEWLHGKGE